MTNSKITFLAFFICLQFSFLAQTNGVYHPASNVAQRPISPPLTVMDATAGIATSYTASACGLNYIQSGVRLTQKPFSFPTPSAVQPATLTVAGIPPCAVILKAFLYTTLSGNGSAFTSSLTNPASVNGTFSMGIIGSDIDVCWGYAGTYSYRADVTTIINGNGNYILSGMPVDAVNDAAGATLFIIYSDPSQLFTGNIVLGDGCRVQTGVNYAGIALTGFNVCGTPSLTTNFMLVADLQGIGNSSVNFNGATNSVADVNYTKLAATDQAWDFITDPGAPIVSGQTVANFGLINPGGDCYCINMTGFYYRSACLTCNGISPGPPLTVSAAGTGSCTGMGTATVSVSGGSGQYYYSWSGTAQTTSVVGGLSTGNYVVSVTDLNSCNTGSAQVNIVSATSSVIATGTTVCAGQTATLTATGVNSCVWTGPANYTSNSVNAVIPSATNSTIVTYTVVGTDANGCTTSATATLLANLSSPQVSVVASKTLVCSGKTVTLTGSGAQSYSWLPAPLTQTQAAVVVTPTSNTTYSVTGIAANGCKKVKTISIQVSKCVGIEEEELSSENLVIYPNPSTGSFEIKGIEKITLELVNTLGQLVDTIVLNDVNQYHYSVNGLAEGIYYVKAGDKSSFVTRKIVVKR